MRQGSKTAVKQWDMTVPGKEANFSFYDGRCRMDSPSVGVPFVKRTEYFGDATVEGEDKVLAKERNRVKRPANH